VLDALPLDALPLDAVSPGALLSDAAAVDRAAVAAAAAAVLTFLRGTNCSCARPATKAALPLCATLRCSPAESGCGAGKPSAA
jgi:hypothetical protein